MAGPDRGFSARASAAALPRAAATRIGIDSATISILIPFPGTRLFARLEREGRILTRDWSKYNGKTDVVFQPRLMTPDRLQAGYEWTRREFYSWPSIWSRLSRSHTGLEWNIWRNIGFHRAVYRHGRGDGCVAELAPPQGEPGLLAGAKAIDSLDGIGDRDAAEQLAVEIKPAEER